MFNGPLLVTERLILRPPAREDFDAWADFHADSDTMRFLGGVQPRAVAWRSLCAMTGAWQIAGFAMFSLIERSTGRWIGRVGPWRPEGWPDNEVGWGVAREFAGRGYAHEAAVASIDYAFDLLGWTDVIHIIDPENTGSVALAKRLGSINRGPTRMPEPYHEATVDAWGQSADQWRARKRGTAG
jgi:RimJ/RimL family protein N-acetyltransferase